MKIAFKEFVDFVKPLFSEYKMTIPLHDPRFIGNEKEYLLDCLDSNFVSSIGEYVSKFEKLCADYTGAEYAIATVNGTAALHISLILSGVKSGEEVITQPVTFIATANAIAYTGAHPVFTDVDKETMGLSPTKLYDFLKNNTFKGKDNFTYNKKTRRKISACLPMHSFGFPCKIDEIQDICDEFNLILIEDAAESLGSFYHNKHTGLFGKFATLSFNGNKIITTGGGGMILTSDEKLAKKAKHLTTQAKVQHPWEYAHDEVGYNYRLTNLSASLGCAQIENLEHFVTEKRILASKYKEFFKGSPIRYFEEPANCRSNYWLNAIVLKDRNERDEFLKFTNDNGVMTRPIWQLMNSLPMFEQCECSDLSNSIWLADRVVNIPSSVPIHDYYPKKK